MNIPTCPPEEKPVGLDRVVARFNHWLHVPDPAAIYVVLATVAANLMPGDPVWTLIVGPPGGGKTEMICSISGLADVHFAATLTEAALLSGTPRKEKARDATGGLLHQVGQFGIVVCKDFTSVLSMNKDGRAQVLAALREVYDGSWTRYVGTDGGRKLHWQGKVGMIAGVTPTIDRHHAVMGAMGERFVLFRLPAADAAELAQRSLMHVGREAEMRHDLSTTVAEFFDSLIVPVSVEPVNQADADRLVNLAVLAVRCRSAVERDPYRREIELIPTPEAPTRLVNVLLRMLTAFRLIGLPDHQAWPIVTKLALDSMPAIRRAVLEQLRVSESETTASVATACGYPTETARRALEDLAAHGVLTRQKSGNANSWNISDWALERLNHAISSHPPDFPVTTGNGIEEGHGRGPTPPSGLSGGSLHERLLAACEELRRQGLRGYDLAAAGKRAEGFASDDPRLAALTTRLEVWAADPTIQHLRPIPGADGAQTAPASVVAPSTASAPCAPPLMGAGGAAADPPPPKSFEVGGW